MRQRGAVAWKVLVAILAGVGAVLAAARLSQDGAPATEAALETPRSPAPVTVAPPRDANAAAAPTTNETQANDPFAGVDVSSDSVLRHIAGIEDKKGARTGTRQRAPVPVADAASRRATEPTPVLREEARTDGKARQIATAPASAAPGVSTAPAAPSTPAAAGSDTKSLAATPPSTVPSSETPSLRTAIETTSSPTAAASTPAVVAVPTTVAAADRSTPRGDPAATAAPAAQAAPRMASRTVPEFPGEAIRAGVSSGRVVARLSIDADGRVTQTQILSATPSGLFERESRRALSTWRYEPTGRPTTTDVELIFTRD